MGGTAPVEPKGELVEVHLQVLGAHAVMSAAKPGLEVPEDAVNPWQDLLGPFRVPLGARTMAISHRREGGVTRPAIGKDDRIPLDVCLHETRQRGARGVRNHLEADSPRGLTAYLDGRHHQRLVEKLSAAPQAGFRA